jgi:DNA-binding NarL/FixJ family response regulator
MACSDPEPGSTDGLQLTRQVRQEWPETRTIILTAYGAPETERVARRIGVDAFLHKPAPLADLARVADDALVREHYLGMSRPALDEGLR